MDSCKFPRLSRSCKATSIYARCFQPWKGPPIFPRLSQLQEFLEHNIKKFKNPLYFKMRWTLSVLFPKRQTHIPRIHARAHAHTHTHKAACSKCQHTIWYLTYKLPWPVVLTLFFFFYFELLQTFQESTHPHSSVVDKMCLISLDHSLYCINNCWQWQFGERQLSPMTVCYRSMNVTCGSEKVKINDTVFMANPQTSAAQLQTACTICALTATYLGAVLANPKMDIVVQLLCLFILPGLS